MVNLFISFINQLLGITIFNINLITWVILFFIISFIFKVIRSI